MDEWRRQLADKLGLTPTNPWVWKLKDEDVAIYLDLAENGKFSAIPLPLWTEPNGLQVFGDPAYHERRKQWRNGIN